VTFDPDCSLCPRLAGFLEQSRQHFPGYHCAPVAPFGDADTRLLVVGLAPGLHGANRTGRPFTGDYAGILLYETLHDFGWASHPRSESAGDGLRLTGCRITNAVKCVPPQNKPEAAEVRRCNVYLAAELEALDDGAVVLALGTIAHGAVLRAMGLKASAHPFGHGAEHGLPGERTLIDSYHCSRYNTQTRRLTGEMFKDVVGRATALSRMKRSVA
jgi:uracil-DNA glycosylase family 4